MEDKELNEYLLEYNPLAKQCFEWKNKSEHYRKTANKNKELVKWYKSRTYIALKEYLEICKERELKKRKEIEDLCFVINDTENKIKQLQKGLKSTINPLRWFSGSQKNINNEIKSLSIRLKKKQKLKNNSLDDLEKIEKEKKSRIEDIKLFSSFNLKETETETYRVLEVASQFEQKIKKLTKTKEKIDVSLKPIIHQLLEKEKQLKKLNRLLIRAEDFDSQLSNASSGRERALFHERCEFELGKSQPRSIINRTQKKIDGIERNLKKIRTRASSIVEKAQREIEFLIIDGNNLCYEDDKFIGIIPLQKLVAEFHNKYKFIVIFDASIKHLAKVQKRDLIKMFPKSIKVHVVPPQNDADLSILEMASGEPKNFIISNDRFSDYFDQEVVENKRIISHEIINKKIIIHDL